MSSPSNWQWLRLDVVLAIHEAQLSEHGGRIGVRSRELLESALARPQTFAASTPDTNAATIGAMHAMAFARNHPFVDGNKRTAWVAMRTFFELNDVEFRYDPVEAIAEMLALAAGERTDEAFIAWVRSGAHA